MSFVVLVDGQLVGRGTYKPKKDIALNRAAKDALDNVGIWLTERDTTSDDAAVDVKNGSQTLEDDKKSTIITR